MSSNKKRTTHTNALSLSEAQIRYAMQHTNSCRSAANWLHVNYTTYKKYASMYIDFETGKTLFELHKSQIAKKAFANKMLPKSDASGNPLKRMRHWPTATLQDIYAGKHPGYNRSKLIKRMIKEGDLLECCDNCGYSTKRDFDFKVPLKIWYQNSDPADMSKENLRLLCFNCYFLLAFPHNGSADLTELYSNNILRKPY